MHGDKTTFSKDLYEEYHGDRRLQKRILGEKNFTYCFLISALRKYLKPVKNILDIGCGTGAIDFYLAKSGKNITGLDISKRAITSAKQSAKYLGLERKVSFFVSNFPNTKISKKFDLVLCSEVLEHLEDDSKAVAKIYDLLRCDGIAIFSSPSKNSVLFKLGFTKNFDKNVGHLRRYDQQNFSDLVKSAGFKIINVKKEQGFFRDLLFISSLGNFIVRIANRFDFVSDFLTLIDNLFLPFGESDILIVVRK